MSSTLTVSRISSQVCSASRAERPHGSIWPITQVYLRSSNARGRGIPSLLIETRTSRIDRSRLRRLGLRRKQQILLSLQFLNACVTRCTHILSAVVYGSPICTSGCAQRSLLLLRVLLVTHDGTLLGVIRCRLPNEKIRGVTESLRRSILFFLQLLLETSQLSAIFILHSLAFLQLLFQHLVHLVAEFFLLLCHLSFKIAHFVLDVGFEVRNQPLLTL